MTITLTDLIDHLEYEQKVLRNRLRIKKESHSYYNQMLKDKELEKHFEDDYETCDEMLSIRLEINDLEKLIQNTEQRLEDISLEITRLKFEFGRRLRDGEPEIYRNPYKEGL